MREWGRRCRWAVTHLCWSDGEPDPRVLQLGFTVGIAAVLVLRTLAGEPPAPVSWPVAGLAISVLGGAALLLARPARVSSVALVMAVVHIAVLGMLAADGDPGGASPLLLLPALWLGQELGSRGAVLAVVATTGFLTVPGLVLDGTDLDTVERLMVLPAVAGVGAVAISAGLAVARAAQGRAEAREAELESALVVNERSRRSAHAIFDAVDIGLALFERDGRPGLMNQRVHELAALAYPRGDLSQVHVYDESGHHALPLERVPTARAQHGEELDDVRIWVGADERTRRALSVSARRVEDRHGELVGAAVSYSDVTELMRALRVKDDFIALVSHELRTPLTSIVGYVDIALDDGDLLDPVLRRQLEVVARNARRLERLVDDLLDEIQHPRREAMLREQRTDLAGILRDSVVAARPHAVATGVTLSATIPESVPFTGDAERLAQVVDNLISNAIKYTPSGGHAQVRVEVEEERVLIRVSDTGIGIDPADQAQIFTRFFRTREATLRAIQGVGLGLSISRSIVEGHGGRIEVDSEVGRGSEFRVVLPLDQERLAS